MAILSLPLLPVLLQLVQSVVFLPVLEREGSVACERGRPQVEDVSAASFFSQAGAVSHLSAARVFPLSAHHQGT